MQSGAMIIRVVTICLLLAANLLLASGARADTASVLTIWRLLDYVAVDYREAVRDGTVVSAEEYAEMVEFSASVKERLDTLQ